MDELQETLELLKAEHTLASLITCHFMAAADEEFVTYCRSRDYRGVIDAFAADAAVGGDLAQGAALMGGYLDATAALSAGELAATLEQERTLLYRNADPACGLVQPCESDYRGLAEVEAKDFIWKLTKEYGAHDMMVARTAHERADYLGVMLEYVSVLLAREAKQLAEGNEDDADETDMLLMIFVRRHLKWVPAFVEAAYPQAQTDFYRGHLLMLRGFVEGLAG